ncbi:MAG: hypothetical protein WCG94_08620 [Methanothrix sp.]
MDQVKCRFMNDMRFYPETFLAESKEVWPDAECAQCGEPIDVGETIWAATWEEFHGEGLYEPLSEEWCDECARTHGKPVEVPQESAMPTRAEQEYQDALEDWWYDGGPESGRPLPKQKGV